MIKRNGYTPNIVISACINQDFSRYEYSDFENAEFYIEVDAYTIYYRRGRVEYCRGKLFHVDKEEGERLIKLWIEPSDFHAAYIRACKEAIEITQEEMARLDKTLENLTRNMECSQSIQNRVES